MLAFVVVAGLAGMLTGLGSALIYGSLWMAVSIYAATGFVVLCAALARAIICDAMNPAMPDGVTAGKPMQSVHGS